MSKINKVLYNVDQRDSDSSKGNTREEMWMARNNIGLDEVIGHATVTEYGKEYTGIAPLGTNGLVPAEYLPSYVDDVKEGYYYNGLFYSDREHREPIGGEPDKIYVDITDPSGGETYRYNDTSKTFILISAHKSFGHIGVGSNTISATELSDTFKVDQGNGISVVADTSGKKITVGHSNNVSGGECGPTADVTSVNFTVPYVKYDNCGHITAGVNRLITIPDATTNQVGVVKISNDYEYDESDKVPTSKALFDGLASIESGLTSHGHGNITSDGKVTKEATSMKAMLITNSGDQVVVGPAFGTGAGDDNLFLNKRGNWSAINEASANAVGGIKIGFTKNATKYPVELSDGKAYVDVPCSEIKVWKGGSSGSVHQNLMTIYEVNSTGACASIAFNNESSTVSMVKVPSAGDGGKVLTAVEPGGSVTPYFAWLPTAQSGILKRNNAELYFHHTAGDTHVYKVRNIKNNAMNHVTVANHSDNICSITIEAPTIGQDEEQNYYVVFDCNGSSGSCEVDVENASPRLLEDHDLAVDGMYLKTNLFDNGSDAEPMEALVKNYSGDNKFLRIDGAYYPGSIEGKTLAGPYVLTGASLIKSTVTKHYVGFSGSPTYMIHVIGGMWEMYTY